MKLGFSTLGCPKWSIDEVISIALKCGYDGFEIRSIRGEVVLPNLEEFQPSNIKGTYKKISDSGLEVVCISTSVRFNIASKEEQEKQLISAAKNMDIAAGLGAKFIRIFGGPLLENQDREESVKWITEGFEKIGQLGESKGITVLLETHDSFSTGKQVSELLSKVNSKNINVLWDILHPYRHGESFIDTYKEVGNLVKHVHIKDSKNFSPKSFDLKLVSEGNVPVADALAVLKDNNYDAYLSFEWEKAWHPEIEEPEIAIPHYADIMRKLLK